MNLIHVDFSQTIFFKMCFQFANEINMNDIQSTRENCTRGFALANAPPRVAKMSTRQRNPFGGKFIQAKMSELCRPMNIQLRNESFNMNRSEILRFSNRIKTENDGEVL